MSDALTREQIESWKGWYGVGTCVPPVEEFCRLCDMALRSLGTPCGFRPIGIVDEKWLMEQPSGTVRVPDGSLCATCGGQLDRCTHAAPKDSHE